MEDPKTKLFKALTVLAMMSVVLVAAMVATEIKGYRFIGGGVAATNTVAVSGDGEVYAAPDIATISFSVREEAKKVADAQNKVSERTKAVLAAVKKAGVPDKDIQTQSYSSYPKYEWQDGAVSCLGLNCLPAATSAQVGPPPRPGRQMIVGYEVSQSVVLTVRNLEIVNNIVAALGQANVSDMYGPNFAIDKEDDLKAEARKQAIEKARTKAEVLARDLGVTLVRVVSFSEGGYYPMYARTVAVEMGKGMGGDVAPSPELPQGQTKITSNVTVTYEIR